MRPMEKSGDSRKINESGDGRMAPMAEAAPPHIREIHRRMRPYSSRCSRPSFWRHATSSIAPQAPLSVSATTIANKVAVKDQVFATSSAAKLGISRYTACMAPLTMKTKAVNISA
eukprot:scaffold30427_cov139-Isochrysis_galbana.AAC.6